MLDKELFRDKVYACWMGKNIGGTLGGPLEGRMELLEVKGYTQEFVTAVENDDLDLQLVNLHCLEQYGGQVTSANLAKEWMSHVHFQFDEYGHALTNMRKGFRPPLSGNYNNFFTDCMGAPIRSELWGIVCVGKPELAACYACQDACVDHAGGEGVWGEIFFAVLECLAFDEMDVEKLIRIALSYIPEESRTAGAVRLLLKSWQEKKSWQENRELLIQKYAGENFTDAPLNIAFTLMGLLYGKSFTERILITANCGYDTDCTCATIGSIMGILNGTSYLDEQWVKPLGEKILVSSPIYGFDVPKSIGELTDRSIRAAKLTAALYESIPSKEIFAVNCETDREITFLPEGSFTSFELICETQYQNGNPSIRPGEEKQVYLTVENRSLVSYTLDVTVQVPCEMEVLQPVDMNRGNSKKNQQEGETIEKQIMRACSLSIAPGERQRVTFRIRAKEDSEKKAFYSCRFFLKQKISGNWMQMEVPFTLTASNDWKMEADGISLGIFHATDSEVRMKQVGLPEGKAKVLRASSKLWLPNGKEVRLLVICRNPVVLRVDGRIVAGSNLETPLIPAYHRAPPEKCADLYLASGYHDVEICMKDVEERDVLYFYVVNPADYFAAEIDCVLSTHGL